MPAPVVQIRPIDAGGLRAASALFVASWRHAYQGILTSEYLGALSVEERYARDLKHLEHHEVSYLGAYLGDLLVGATMFGRSQCDLFPDDGEITALYLLPGYIGSGFGHPLFEQAEQELYAQGFSHLIVGLFEANTRARRFYEAHAYRQVATLPEDPPVIVMRK